MKQIFQLIIVILLSVLLFSCKATKDMKAVARVTYDKTLFNKVGSEWAIQNPCPPASVEYIPGKTDTIITVKRNNDSLNNIIDSLLTKNCPNENLDSLKKAITKEVSKRCKTDTVKLLRVDTLKIPDLRQLQIAKDTANFMRGQITSLNSQVEAYKKSNTNKTWWIVGISAFSLIIIGGLIYLLFQKKLL